jgi:hypothetical protein
LNDELFAFTAPDADCCLSNHNCLR